MSVPAEKHSAEDDDGKDFEIADAAGDQLLEGRCHLLERGNEVNDDAHDLYQAGQHLDDHMEACQNECDE